MFLQSIFVFLNYGALAAHHTILVLHARLRSRKATLARACVRALLREGNISLSADSFSRDETFECFLFIAR